MPWQRQLRKPTCSVIKRDISLLGVSSGGLGPGDAVIQQNQNREAHGNVVSSVPRELTAPSLEPTQRTGGREQSRAPVRVSVPRLCTAMWSTFNFGLYVHRNH